MKEPLSLLGLLWLVLPGTLAIMGSPPTNLPSCLHGGRQTIIEDRYSCDCPDSRMDRQCKLTRVSIENNPVEMQYGPISVQLTATNSFHMSLEFITNEPGGTGSLITIRNSDDTVQLRLFLIDGRPGLVVNLGGSDASIQFTQTPVMNDNAWHYLDIFLEAETQSSVTVYLMVDWCRYASVGVCVLKQSVPIASDTIQLGGTVQLGSDSSVDSERFNGCIDKVNLNGELLDFFDATWGQKSSQGCQRSEQGCQKDGQPICGTQGVCLNALRETDMLTCRCRTGYQPDTSTERYPHRWPCRTASRAWSTTGTEYNAKFLNIIPGRFRMSIRTRNQNFVVFAVAAWKLYLKVVNTTLHMEVTQTKVELNKVNISDGNWHLFDVTLTQNYIRIQIDELDGDFYAALRLPNVTLTNGPVDIVIAKDAQGSCLDDAWVDFVDKWPNFEMDYPLVTLSKPTYTRHVQWSATGRQQSCDAGSDICVTQTPCDPSATCVSEWRGFRCECPNELKPDTTGKCVSPFCVPNPCVNGNCSVGNTTAGRNFTCLCDAGWRGELCSESDFATAELSWWWILLIVLIILLIVIIIIIVICCCQRRARKRAERENNLTILEDDQFGMHSQVNDPWDSGEKDFMGSIDHSFLQPNRRFEDEPDVKINGRGRIDLTPRDHGQKTSDRPPWEQFEGRENPGMNLDQVLEYGYEGYDGKPPPDFCPTEPPTFIGADDELDEDVSNSDVPNLSRMSQNRSTNLK